MILAYFCTELYISLKMNEETNKAREVGSILLDVGAALMSSGFRSKAERLAIISLIVPKLRVVILLSY